MGSQAPPRVSGHARGAAGRSTRRDKRARAATTAKPHPDWGRAAGSPGRHGVPRRQPGRRRQTGGSSTRADRPATRREGGVVEGRDGFSNAFTPSDDRSCKWHTALRVGAGRRRNRLPRRAVQGFDAHLPQGDEEAGDAASATLALQRPQSQARARGVPLVRMAPGGRAAPGEGDRSDETRGVPLARTNPKYAREFVSPYTWSRAHR